jgi:hypothetical protein
MAKKYEQWKPEEQPLSVISSPMLIASFLGATLNHLGERAGFYLEFSE